MAKKKIEPEVIRQEVPKLSFWGKIKKNLGFFVAGGILLLSTIGIIAIPVSGPILTFISGCCVVGISGGTIGLLTAIINKVTKTGLKVGRLRKYFKLLKEIDRADREGTTESRKHILKLHKKLLKCKYKLHGLDILASNRWIDDLETPLSKKEKKYSKLTALHQRDVVTAKIKSKGLRKGIRLFATPHKIPFILSRGIFRNQKKTEVKYKSATKEYTEAYMLGGNTPSYERSIDNPYLPSSRKGDKWGYEIADPRTGIKTDDEGLKKDFENIVAKNAKTINSSPYSRIVSIRGVDDEERYEIKTNSKKIMEEGLKALCKRVQDQPFTVVEADTKYKGKTGIREIEDLAELKEYFGIRTEKKKKGKEQE